MPKLAIVENCWHCPHAAHPETAEGEVSICAHPNKHGRPIMFDIPTWCPLPDTPAEPKKGH